MCRLATCFWVSICTASPQGLSVAPYILHMNDVVWPWLVRFFSMSSFHGLGIVLLCIYVPIAVFAVGSLIEFIRINIFRLFSK